MYVRSYLAIVFCSNHCFRETIRIWHLSAADRKIRPIDIKTGQIKRITRVLEVGVMSVELPILPDFVVSLQWSLFLSLHGKLCPLSLVFCRLKLFCTKTFHL